MRKITSVAVVGAGQMGLGIAQCMAAAGLEVRLYDVSNEAVKKALIKISESLTKFVDKGKLAPTEREATLKRIAPVSTLNDLADIDLVVEAVAENEQLKLKLFSELDRICKAGCLLASNTSSISITKLAAATTRPESVIGMHFMNPVPLMQLVEIIRGLQTGEECYQTALEVVSRIGKTAVTARCDYPGFVVNRILVPMINEAAFVLMEGIATPEEIDAAMKLGTNQPIGPLALADMIGLDTCLAITQIFQRELGEDKYRPCPLLVKYVEAGWLGRKTGRGFFSYR